MESQWETLFQHYYMTRLEKKVFSEQLPFAPAQYCRYGDDTFCIFNSTEHANEFLEHINSLNEKIKFTVENMKNNAISFLDVQVTLKNGKLLSTNYGKLTFTGILMSYHSITPKLLKLNSIRSMIFLAYKIS